jgi:hypothetical protein
LALNFDGGDMKARMSCKAKAATTPTPSFVPSRTILLQRNCACGRKLEASGECEECRKKRLQRQLGNPRSAIENESAVPPIVNEVLNSPGEPLSAETRAFMEPRFGHDFSKVDVHTASRHARGLAPTAAPGGLLVNELGDCYEREADRESDQVMRMTGTPGVASAIYNSVVSRGTDGGAIQRAFLTTAGRPTARATKGSDVSPDFSGVRVHTTEKAAESAKAVSALAYTVGQHIVFAAGQYAPGSTEGRRLLAHELVHTIQQSAASGPLVMRTWDKAAECSGAPTDKWIQKVVVNQETPQTATIHWSDGSTESDACSSGKGHCCVDPSNPSGVGCTVEQSQTDGSNCTPITRAMGFPVKNRVRDHKGVEFWTEFVPDRAIALHEYSPVDGTPLSHGCVRLHTDFATKIFCNVRQNATWVQVQGFARPKCDHGNLQKEWEGDFAMGGADLSKADGDEKGEIRETRRELNAAFGRTLSVTEIQALTAKDIPRCRATAPLPKPKTTP